VKRLLALLPVLALLAVALVASGSGKSGSSGYRVDAIFDNTGFLVPGQDVKIAGAKVGKVTDIRLTKDRQGLVEMEIDKGFAPFRADADCTVQPQSLIGERFIQCFPGSVAKKVLADGEGGRPTVPITHTHSPVDLDLVLTAFRGPEPQRLALLLSSLGAGVAGRADDLNAIIRRANPALQQTANVLRTVNANRDQLRSLISGADTVVAELARRNTEVQRFVKSTGDLAATTAERRTQLAATVRDLPKVLEQLPGYLDAVEATLDVAPPDLDALRASAKPLDGLLTQVDSLSTDTRPAIRELATTARKARQIIPPTETVLDRLDRFTKSALPAATLIDQLLQSSKLRGVIEGVQTFAYYAVAATARYDSNGHLLGAYPVVTDRCSIYATVPVPACDSHFAAFKGQPTYEVAKKKQGKPAAKGTQAQGGAETAPAAPTAPGTTSTGPATPTTPAEPEKPTLQTIVPKLLDSISGLLGGKKSTPPPPASGASTPAPPAPATATDLLDFLLGR
jgi:virulence factor Mce-like protein